MKLYELLSKEGFHTSIVTSFGVDFDAYENVMLSRFRGAGCHNNLLIVDGGMLSYALDGASAIPQHAGKTYTVTGARARGTAVFHPKLILQFGRKTGRMIVSSANVSAAGLAGNLEVAAMIECDGTDSAETALLAAGWEFAERSLDPDDRGIRHQVGFMKSRTPWLRDASPASGIVKLADGTAARFIGSGAAESIAGRFIQSVGTERIKRLIIISPYWDDELAAMLHLMRSVKATDTRLLSHLRTTRKTPTHIVRRACAARGAPTIATRSWMLSAPRKRTCRSWRRNAASMQSISCACVRFL